MIASYAAAMAVVATMCLLLGWDTLRRRPRKTAEDRIRRGVWGDIATEAIGSKEPRTTALEHWLERAERAGIGPVMLIGSALAGGVVVGGMLFALVGGDVAPLLAGLIGSVLAPFALLRFRENAHQNLLSQQFEQAIEQLVAGLRAGATLHQAFEHVAAEAPMPLSAEFRVIAQRMGVAPVEDAVGMLTERIPGAGTRLFVTAVAFQAGTGGALSDVLLQVADALRERRQFQQQALAATAEGRMTAWLMAGMPLFLLGAFRVMAPGYLDTLTGSTWGQLMTLGALGMVAVGVMVVHQMAASVAGGGES